MAGSIQVSVQIKIACDFVSHRVSVQKLKLLQRGWRSHKLFRSALATREVSIYVPAFRGSARCATHGALLVSRTRVCCHQACSNSGSDAMTGRKYVLKNSGLTRWYTAA